MRLSYMVSPDIIGVPPSSTGKIGPGSSGKWLILVALATTNECVGMFLVFLSNALHVHSQMMHF